MQRAFSLSFVCLLVGGCFQPLATVSDSGLADAGGFDAGTTDVGQGDAGAFDAGANDAGVQPVCVALPRLDAGTRPRQHVATCSPAMQRYALPAIPLPHDTYAIAVGNFDGNGHPDLVAASASGLAIELGHGDGTFAPPTALVAGAGFGPLLQIGDFDGDGRADIITGGGDGGALAAYSFAPGNGLIAEGFSDAGRVLAIAVGDLDGDHRDEIVTFSANSTVQVWRLADGGALTGSEPIGVPGSFAQVSLADVNGDGFPDVLVHGWRAGTLLLMNRCGKLMPPVDIPALSPTDGGLPYALGFGDLDGDGRTDALAVTEAALSADEITAFRGIGDGGFIAAGTLAIRDPQAAVFGDLDGDGRVEAAISTRADGLNLLYVIRLEPDGGVGVDRVYAADGQHLLADADGDGALDLVSFGAPGLTDTAFIERNDGLGRLQAPWALDYGPSQVDAGRSSYVAEVWAADLDGDGLDDLFELSVNNQTALRFGYRDGGFSAAVAGPPVHPAIFADIDGDGRADIVTASGYSTPILHGLGDGGFEQVSNLPCSPDAWIPPAQPGAPADFFGQGMDRELAGYAYEPDGGFSPISIDTQDAGVVPDRIVVGDVDGDGLPDLIVRAGGAPTILMQRDGGFVRIPVPYNTQFNLSDAVGDFDGDGRADIYLDHLGYIEYGVGDGTFVTGNYSPQRDIDLLVGPVVDLDGDGIDDLPFRNEVQENGVPPLAGIWFGTPRNGPARTLILPSATLDVGQQFTVGNFEGTGREIATATEGAVIITPVFCVPDAGS